MYDSNRRRFARKLIPAKCPFCKAKIAKPSKMAPNVVSPGTKAGRCDCGAVYIFDEAGKGGGEALIDGLMLLSDGDTDRMLALQETADYKMARRGYQPRTHSYDRRVKKKGAYSQPKLWFFCLRGASDDE